MKEKMEKQGDVLLNELAGEQQIIVQHNFSPYQGFTKDTTQSRENRLGRTEKGQENQEQTAFKKSYLKLQKKKKKKSLL